MDKTLIIKCATTTGLAMTTMGLAGGVAEVSPIVLKTTLAASAAFFASATYASISAGLTNNNLKDYLKALPNHTAVAMSALTTFFMSSIVFSSADAIADAVQLNLFNNLQNQTTAYHYITS